MSDTVPAQTPSVNDPAPAVVPAVVAAPVVPAATVPEGFVPRADLEREQARSREFQGRADRVQQQLAALARGDDPGTPSPKPSGTSGFDPEKFQSELLGKTYGALTLLNAVPGIKAEFPNADPTFFDPDMLQDFGSAEALRAAVEADHKRVQALIDAALVAAGGAPGAGTAGGAASPLGPAGAGGQSVAGEPSVQDLAKLTVDDLAQYELDHPGVIARVMAKATT